MEESDSENVPVNKKCGYCGHLLQDLRRILDHTCFQNYDEDSHFINVDENHSVTIVAYEASNEASLRWNNDWDEFLIKAVSQRPALYNYRLSLSERTDLKISSLWMEIYNCLGGPCELKYIKNRWKNLRDLYLKAKVEERAYVRSGSAAPNKNTSKHKFQLFEMMTFLDDLSEPMRTVTSLTSDNESDTENEYDKSKVEKHKKDEHFYEILCESLESPVPSAREIDPVECLLLSMGPQLRELDEDRRSRVKKQFQEILLEELQRGIESTF